MLKKLLFSMALVLGFTSANAQLVDDNLFIQGGILYKVANGATEVHTNQVSSDATHDGTTGAPLAVPVTHAYTDAVVTIPDNVTVGAQTFAVTQIGAFTWDGNITLTSLTLGANITTIGNRSIRGAANLATLDLTPATGLTTVLVRGLQSLNGLTSPLEFPASFTTFGAQVFNSCTNISLHFNGPVTGLTFPGNILTGIASGNATLTTANPADLAGYGAVEPFATYYSNTLSTSDVRLEDTVKISIANKGATLKISGIEYNALSIYSITGKKVTVSTDISALAPGLYIAVISTDGGSVSKKFVK
ncbi:leucine-rich repeat domain-containing protein [Tamlana agarivorans]|uniref:Leucine-rich repeat domain-containing protein n=1 Tax=Pseudotamlana agarivorans TaxID=481183 RepID=A0ACC5UAI0_9FLAO|nr:T9SS type A sorting domain-containing protein [Tamlana agarivorans]MBU2951324.1 leucine-rich repeat domain-containing protein [Tamlana agarivorans]